MHIAQLLILISSVPLNFTYQNIHHVTKLRPPPYSAKFLLEEAARYATFI